MPHISYSELKDWVTCAFYHKLTRVDKLKGFKGNEFTAFGTAIHHVCEQVVMDDSVDMLSAFNNKFLDELDQTHNLTYITDNRYVIYVNKEDK